VPLVEEEPEGMTLEVLYLILADGAQVQGGKLYVLGGGWDRVQLPEYPSSIPVGIALGVRVPWNQTNQRHTFRISGKNADETQELFEAEGEFEVGRPPGTPPGMPQMFQAAMRIPLQVPAPGQYIIEADIDDGKARRELPFFAVQIPRVQMS
jgi:hypothetical protein